MVLPEIKSDMYLTIVKKASFYSLDIDFWTEKRLVAWFRLVRAAEEFDDAGHFKKDN